MSQASGDRLARVRRAAIRRRERERMRRRTLAGGLAASAALHLAFIALAGRIEVQPAPFRLPLVETVPAPNALVVVDIAPELLDAPSDPRPEPTLPDEEAAAPETEPVDPEDLEDEEEDPAEVEEGVPLPGVPGLDVPGAPRARGEEGEGRSNADRLTLQFSDARIWFDPQSPRLVGERLIAFARADSAVRAILREWLDSLQLDEDVRRRALDWTVERDGKRWGFSPEGIHLGDVVIPIPIGFAPTGPQRRAYEQAIRDLTAIQLQDLRADVEAAAAEARERLRQRTEEEVRRRTGDTLRIRGPP